jgi:putative transposase
VDNTKANTLIIGSLDVKSMAKSGHSTRSLNRSVQNAGYLARSAGLLAYKSRLAGKSVIGISEANTSRMCCACGKQHEMPLSRRTMECDCGNSIDRDRNSAVNIMIRFLSHNTTWSGCPGSGPLEGFLGNLRQTGLLIQKMRQAPAGMPHL